MSILTKRICVLICAALLFLVPRFSTASADEPADPWEEPEELPYSEVPLYADGVCLGFGINVGGVTLVPLRTFTETLLQEECVVDWDQDTGTAVLTSQDLLITLTLDDGYMAANGRYFYLGSDVYNINGTIVVPIRELAKLFGAEICWDSENWAINIDISSVAPLLPGEQFYDPEALYWLSHVIYSESGNQPLEGMIGVGNVVLNRAADESGVFGDGIEGVIFLPGQFDVVPAGTIYMEPSEAAVAAAKLCLEGYNTVGAAKWFVNPAIGSVSWFKTYKTYAITIADHDFYA